MNVFYLNKEPATIAKWLVDRHIVKMPLESGQMLSTAKRLLDGEKTTCSAESPADGKMLSKTFWLFAEERPILSAYHDGSTLRHRWVVENSLCYQVAHAKHPSTVWTMDSSSNYKWHVLLLKEMLSEYTRRYGKKHSTESIVSFLEEPPKNIACAEMTQPPPAMPNKYKHEDSVISYMQYYVGEKWKFAKWKEGEIPSWFIETMNSVWKKDTESKLDKATYLNECFHKKSWPMDSRIALAATEILKNV
jgi:hypothetical protein